MNNKPDPEESLHQRILDSSGMKFLNQLHTRSFSLNIFQMNALELLEATLKVRDPNQGSTLMSQANREARQQYHRELSRHVHNFVASSKTLVDHTRVFMKENYIGTQLHEKYQIQVTSIFDADPVSKFVHDLRNYMLHKCLPNSYMFITINQEPTAPEIGAEITTGSRFDTKSLLEWNGWTAPAKQYIKQAGEFIDIHKFVDEYLVRINQFHNWLETLLQEHHALDLEELARLQESNVNESTQAFTTPQLGLSNSINTNVETQTPPLTFNSQDTIAINEMSHALLLKVREFSLPTRASNDFPTQRPTVTVLTDADIIGMPVFSGTNINGEEVHVFIRNDKKLFGLTLSDLDELENICDRVHSARWAKDMLSRQFIENEFFAWAHDNFLNLKKNLFSEAIIKKSREEIRALEVWAPIAHLEVESEFEFGPVKIVPITSDKINEIEQMTQAISTVQKSDTQELFDSMRDELQGFAAVVVSLEVEPILAEEKGLMIAQDAVSLLRFFSPATSASWALCPTALYGSEIVPKSKLLILSESSFMMTDKITPSQIGFWRLPQRDIKELEKMGISEAGKLVSPADLSDFESSIRLGLITYSKGTTFPTLIDRLTHTLSAVQEVFLRHEMEPIESNIAKRMSLILSNQDSERTNITQNVRQAYWLRGEYRTSPLSPHEQEIIAQFTANAHKALKIALQNIGSFQTKNNFIEAVEQLES